MIFPTQKEVKAILVEVREETHLTKWFRFKVQDDSFHFLPGQWLDLRPDDSFPWGGYSMMSPPSDLPYFELGLRKGKSHPTTGWLFEKAREGDSVIIHGPGGRTVYDPELHQESILIMGGIGVTPLLSMARTLYENKTLKQNFKDKHLRARAWKSPTNLTTKEKDLHLQGQGGHITVCWGN